jgi:hypothetical protein
MRTTLKQEISIATALPKKPVDYNLRTSLDLNRVMEDQWRKELQEKLLINEKQELEELEEQQKLVELKQKEKEEKKIAKVNSTIRGVKDV